MDKGKAKLTAYEEEPDKCQSSEDDLKREFEFCVAEGMGQSAGHGSQCLKKFMDYEEEPEEYESLKDDLNRQGAFRVAQWVRQNAVHMSQQNKKMGADGMSIDDIFLEPCGNEFLLETCHNAAEEHDFLETQVANNVMMAAYKEIMTIALNANTWVVGTPAVGSVEYFLDMSHSSPPSGFGIESSIERAVLPIEPRRLVSLMMDVDEWAMSLSRIVRRGCGSVDYSIDVKLRLADSSMKNPTLVNAEFHLPTPFVPTRKYCFLRCQKQIIKNIWAIIDASVNYFCGTPDSTLEHKCRRRPSGVIIRGHGHLFENSEVIWIENVQGHECVREGNIYSNIINSNLGFCAKRWVNTLAQKFKQGQSRFINHSWEENRHASVNLMLLAEDMEKVFMEYVNEAPNRSKWIILSDEKARVLMDITGNLDGKLDSNNYIALTSFRIDAKPLSVFHYLSKKNMELQWGRSPYQDEPEGMMQLVSTDRSYCVSLHNYAIPQDDLTERQQYFLQEVSEDEFCSFVLSSQLIESHVYAALLFGDFCCKRDVNVLLQPSGFAIMPGGTGGLQADASLVTIALRRELQLTQGAEAFAIKAMNDLITETIEDIREAVADQGDSLS